MKYYTEQIISGLSSSINPEVLFMHRQVGSFSEKEATKVNMNNEGDAYLFSHTSFDLHCNLIHRSLGNAWILVEHNAPNVASLQFS